MHGCACFSIMCAKQLLTCSALSAITEEIVLYPNPPHTHIHTHTPEESVDSEESVCFLCLLIYNWMAEYAKGLAYGWNSMTLSSH